MDKHRRPTQNTSRVLFPADYAAVSGAAGGKLSCVRFPHFPDDPAGYAPQLEAAWPAATTPTGVGSLGVDNTQRFDSDHSYPSACKCSRSLCVLFFQEV